jgi:hypothetical protein
MDAIRNPETMLQKAERILAENKRDAVALGVAGVSNLILGNVKLAEVFSKKALNEKPQDHRARFNLASSLLKQGRWLEAWGEYEARWKLQARLPAQNLVPEWRGQPGQVLIIYEQGLGDTIMMMRFAKRIEEISGLKPDLHCQPSLVSLAVSTGFFRKVNQWDSQDWKYHVTTLGIPRAIKLTPEQISGKPYLIRGPDTGETALCWSGNTANAIDCWRSLSDQDASKLVRPGMVSVCLDRIIPTLPIALGGCNDFLETAKRISGLCLLVTVDTAIAHLAGAMGIKTLLMLSKCSDWRWGTDGSSTIWYDSVELFRQEKLGDWNKVVNDVINRCNQLCSGEKP